MLGFIIYYLVIGFSVYGLHELWMYCIHPEQIFGFVQKWITKYESKKGFHNEVIYKSLGGCKYCNRQRFADIGFLFLILNVNPFMGYENLWHLFIYGLFSGYVLAINTLIDYFYQKRITNTAKNIIKQTSVTKKSETIS